MAQRQPVNFKGLGTTEDLHKAGEKAMAEEKAKAPRQTKTKAEKIAILEEKQKQIKARIAKLQATDKAKERKADTRRKAMLGGFVLAAIGKNENANTLFEQFLGTLKRDDDKALFDGYKK